MQNEFNTFYMILGVMRYIDLFCGLGAFHQALNEHECVFACDIDEGVREVYEANYDLKPAGDIREIDPLKLPDFELLCAGFPCQPFSIAGNGEGFNDTVKGTLFYDILRIIDAKKPHTCILENVKNLKTHDDGRTFAVIRDSLVQRGYIVTAKVLNSAHFGSPQARQRIFIVATKDEPFVFPEQSFPEVTVSAILDRSVTDQWDTIGYDLIPKDPEPKPFTPQIVYDVVSRKSGKGGRQGERVYSSDAVGITVCASSGGIGAKTGLYLIGKRIRRLSVLETLRMFGFPDTYRFTCSDEQALFYLGNSVVVNVVSALQQSL